MPRRRSRNCRKLIDGGKYDEAFAGIKQVAVFSPVQRTIDGTRQRDTASAKTPRSDSEAIIYKAHTSWSPPTHCLKRWLNLAYDEAFDEVLSNAMHSVANGEIKQVQQILSPYAGIPIFKPKIKECVRQATFNKLGFLLAAKSLAVAQTIAAYYLKRVR